MISLFRLLCRNSYWLVNGMLVMQVPAEFKDVLDNTVVSAVSHHAPLVSFY